MTTIDAPPSEVSGQLSELIDSTEPIRTTPPISRLRVLEGDSVDPRIQRQMKTLESALGYVPNWIRAWTLGHAHSARFIDYLLPLVDHAGPSSKLSRVDRELIAVVSSGATGCSYCRFNHLGSLGDALGDKYTALRLAFDYRDVDSLTDRQRALADFAVALTKDPHLIGNDEFAKLHGLGLDDETIFEAMLIITMFNAANRLLAALNVLPDAPVFD